MKKNSLITIQKVYRMFLMLIVLCGTGLNAQTDTVHLYYHPMHSAPHDTTEAKIDAWVKSLKGQKVDLQVVAYFHRPEFKKSADARADELFLILNRKARSLINITFIGSKKGKNFQRTTVDLIYISPESAEKAKAAALAEKENKEKQKSEKSGKQDNKKSEKEKKDDKEKATKSEGKNEDPAEKGKAVAAEAKEKNKKPGKDEKEEKDNKESKGEKSEKKKDEKSAKKSDKKETPAVNGSPGVKPAGKGLYVKDEDVKRIKAAKLILAKTDNPEVDAMLENAVKNFWSFNSNITTMTYNEAKTLAKTDKDALIFIIADIKSKSLTHGKGAGAYRTVSYGSSVMLEDGKGKIALASYFPTFGEDQLVTEEGVAFAVSVMNTLLGNMEQQGINNNMTVNKPYEKNSERLKDKTLLIPEGWLHEKTSPAEIADSYKARFDVVSYDNWRDAILNKRSYAYVIIVPVPIGGEFVYQHYLMDAETASVIYVSQPKMATKVAGFNVSKANTGYINSKNLERYNEAFEK